MTHDKSDEWDFKRTHTIIPDSIIIAELRTALATAEARVEKAKTALNGLLAAPTWADQSDRDRDEEDRRAERVARQTLAELTDPL